MSRVVLIHWNAAEGAELASRHLGTAGHRTAVLSPQGSVALRPLAADPPDVFVIDLGRLPSQGRAVGIELRRQKGTRSVPIVFAGGDPIKVARVRELLPDAQFSEWSGIGEALGAAMAHAPAGPVVPGAMESYAGVPLVRKLGIRAGTRIALIGAPEGFAQGLQPLPERVSLTSGGRGGADLVMLFAGSRAELEKQFPSAVRRMKEGGSIWIAWAKKASGIATDLGEAEVRSFGLGRGFVDYKICAIDQTWSGLRFARRKAAGQSARA